MIAGMEERRLSNLEDRTGQVAQQIGTHEAVCLERQKMILNTLASIEGQISRLDDKMATLGTDVHVRIDEIRSGVSRRLDGWLTAIASAGVLSTGTLAVLIITRGLK